MADTKDINSTERLLNVIRGYSDAPVPKESSAEKINTVKSTSNNQTINLTKTFKGKQRFTIGVDIAKDFISLAKSTKTSDGNFLIIDHKFVQYGMHSNIASTEISEILKSSVESFVGSVNDCDVWTVMNSVDVNIHHIKIPRVPKKQMESVIFWTAKKENPIDEKETIFDFEIQGEIIDQGIPKYSVMVYSAPRSEVEKIKLLFSSAGINLSGITVAPFAFQNIFRAKSQGSSEKTYASLFIGQDYSRIDIYKNQNLVMTRGIKTGLSSMVEVMEESIADASPEDRPKKEEIITSLRSMLFDPEKSKDTPEMLDGIQGIIFDIIAPVLERLIRQVERTLEHYASNIGYERVEKLYVSSIISLFYSPFINYISEQLGIKADILDPFDGKSISNSFSSFPPALKAISIPAIGLSLSDNRHTPNLLFTYVEKNKEIRQSRINKAIFVLFGILSIVSFAILSLQTVETKRLNAKRVELEKQLTAYHPIISKDQINRLADEIKIKREINRQYSEKYKGIALIGELSSLTPNSIKLIRIHISVPSPQVSSSSKDLPSKHKEEGVVIEGVVSADRNQLDSILAQYVLTLEKSPLFQSVTVQKNNLVSYKKKEIIHFSLQAKIG